MIFSFVLGWNGIIFFALTLIGSENVKTVSVGIGSMIGQYKVAWNDMMAVSCCSYNSSYCSFCISSKVFESRVLSRWSSKRIIKLGGFSSEDNGY